MNCGKRSDMPTDSRLSRMLHVLIHMDQHEEPMTSDVIAHMLRTNPVVVRRTMSGLKSAGYVASTKGHGGGWTLARPLDQITLRHIHEALGSPKVFAIGLADDDPSCLIEQAVNVAMAETLREAEARLLARLGQITVKSLARDVAARKGDPGDRRKDG